MLILSNKVTDQDVLASYIKLLLDQCSEETLKSFRYFRDGSIQTIKDRLAAHKHTIVTVGSNTIGYGHLEPSDAGDFDWLGICVADPYQHQGHAYHIMESLLSRADREVRLSVDKSNERAIRLYNKCGFELIDSKPHCFFMKKDFDKSNAER